MGAVDPGLLVLGGFAFFFFLLVVAAVRKMARGQIEEGETTKALDEGEEALAAEAEAATAAEVPDAPDEADAAEAPEEPEASDEPSEPDAPDAPPPKSLEAGLEKTRKGFMARLGDLLSGGSLDEDLVDELEALLVTSDIGIRTTERLLGDLRGELSRKELKDGDAVRARLREKVMEIVNVERAPLAYTHQPTVIMVIGVNGVGKTTTIGKLAARLVRDGKKVVLGAGDTFRAAAVEQLEIWGERSGADVVKGAERADPSSVVFDAIQHAKRVNADVCLCDTAGRLHTKVNLMEELKKLRRVMNKAMEGAPHEVMMVLDATTGQNAIQQAEQFKGAVEVDSIALTKLDGTAKGGVVVAICDNLGVPVRYIGIGEQVDDLRDFDPTAFVDALFA